MNACKTLVSLWDRTRTLLIQRCAASCRCCGISAALRRRRGGMDPSNGRRQMFAARPRTQIGTQLGTLSLLRPPGLKAIRQTAGWSVHAGSNSYSRYLRRRLDPDERVSLGLPQTPSRDPDRLLMRGLGVRSLTAAIFNYTVGSGIGVRTAGAARNPGPHGVPSPLPHGSPDVGSGGRSRWVS